ncbi:MAG TPA: flagellar biosynthesis protein FliQ [bacterium]|nr:flagellar biosynthesis protein FliQ [bacterium]HPQ18242.1 flagellar biosynthesis protein FliQ [bacterium]
MTEDLIIDIARNSLLTLIIVSGPMLIISMIVGLIISIIQTTTSIQEMTLTFVPKIIATFLSIVIFGNWMLDYMNTFTSKLWELIPLIAK